MFDVTELLGMMNNGISTDEIASSFTEALNSAREQKKIEDEKLAEEVARLEEKERHTQKLKDTEDLLDIVRDYLDKWYPNVAMKDDTSAEDLIELLDTVLELNVVFKQLGDKPARKRTSVDPIESFLRSFGL